MKTMTIFESALSWLAVGLTITEILLANAPLAITFFVAYIILKSR